MPSSGSSEDRKFLIYLLENVAGREAWLIPATLDASRVKTFLLYRHRSACYSDERAGTEAPAAVLLDSTEIIIKKMRKLRVGHVRLIKFWILSGACLP